MNADDLIVIAYSASNALRVARDRSGAQAISCLSWNLWIAANATTALYAWTQLQDLLLTVVNAGNAACCAGVVLITLAKRSAHTRAAMAPIPPQPEPEGRPS